jgi:uncharacterized protein
VTPAFSRPHLPLVLLPDRLAVARLAPDAPLPPWATASAVFSCVARTPDELSVTTTEAHVPRDAQAERGYRALRVRGLLPFDLIGIFASLAGPLAERGLSIFALSTYDTDYVLVKEPDLGAALEALRRAGHTIDAADGIAT